MSMAAAERDRALKLLREANAEIERLRLELKQANAYLNDAMQKIDNLHIHIVRQDAEIERLKAENCALIVAHGKELRNVTMRSANRTLRREVERLKKALDQAIRIACICVENRMLSGCRIYVYGDGDEDNAFGTEISEAPELAAYLKEKENG